MPRELYNEGRVVGYSAYELYVKHALSEYPEEEPATEREWLSAQLGNGTSMILKVPSDSTTGLHYVDFPLPENSKLLSANVVIGSLFLGNCKFVGSWATKVTDYGQGISNTAASSPSTTTDARTYPRQTLRKFNDTEKKMLLQYTKIQDALILQPGAWVSNTETPPAKDFIPNYHEVPVIRLIFTDKITTSFQILLTGFTHRSIIAGITGIDEGSTKEIHPENGDFLGPELYPWASKIILVEPSTLLGYFIDGLTSTHDNLDIEVEEDGFKTIFTVSPVKSAKGISVVGPDPAHPGSDITISSIISPPSGDTNTHYLKITQTNSDKATGSHVSTTTLATSKLQGSPGVAITQPTADGNAISIGAKIVSDNNYLKVEQSGSAVGDATNATNIRTKLTPATFGNGDGIDVVPPTTPGGTVKFNLNTSYIKNLLQAGDGIKIELVNGKIKISSTIKQGVTNIKTSTGSKLVNDDDTYLQIITSSDGKTVTINLTNKLKNELINTINTFKQQVWNDNGALWKAIGQILSKFPGTNSLATGTKATQTKFKTYTGDINFATWVASGDRLCLGNLNVYSSTNGKDVNRYIKNHQSAANGDLRVN